MSFLSVVFCILFSFKTNFFLRETRDGLKAFSGADMSRARLYRVHRRPLTGSTAGITPVVKARVEWGKKWREKRLRLRTPNGKMVVGCAELRMANNRRDKAEANVAISDQLVSNHLVKDHDAALGVRSFQIPVRISEVPISAM